MTTKAGRPSEGHKGTRVRDYPQLSMRLPQFWVDRFNQRARANSMTRAKYLIHLLKRVEPANADR